MRSVRSTEHTPGEPGIGRKLRSGAAVGFCLGFLAAGALGFYGGADFNRSLYDSWKLSGIKFRAAFGGLWLTGRTDRISHGELRMLVADAARRNSLPPELLWAVISVESSFNPQALSGSGAMGLMQLMPITARELGVEDPWDPEQNISGGAKYLRRLLDRYKGRTELAIAAYNAGPSAIKRFGGVPPYPETKRYVVRVMEIYERERSGAKSVDRLLTRSSAKAAAQL